MHKLRSSEIIKNSQLYWMLIPSLIYLLIFAYFPVARGMEISFMDFSFIGNRKFIGLDNFISIFSDHDFTKALNNTVILAFFNIALAVLLPAAFAILLNEIRNEGFKKLTQTILYIPSLFSWVVIIGIFLFFLSPSVGPFNSVIKGLGFEPVYFFGEPRLSRFMFVFLYEWKNVGFGLIIYLASLVSIDHSLFEAAYVDGATRLQRIIFITIPSLSNTFKLMVMLNVMGMLMMFEQAYVMMNPLTTEKLDVIVTYIYRVGITRLNMGEGAAASIVVLVLTLVLTLIAKKLTHYGYEENN